MKTGAILRESRARCVRLSAKMAHRYGVAEQQFLP